MYCLRNQFIAVIAMTSILPVSYADESMSAETVQRLKDATVYVKTEIGPLKMTGTGFVFDVSGDTVLIATNNHVISKPAELKQGGYIPGLSGRDRFALLKVQQALASSDPTVSIVFKSGTSNEQSIKAELLGGIEEPDLAILRVSGVKSVPKPIPFQKTTAPFETMSLYILGFPFGDVLSTNDGNPTITIGKGSISSIRNDSSGKLVKLQIDGAINPGNSGGPVVDTKGNLVGIAVQTIQGSNIGLAIPPHELTAMLDGRVGTPTIVVSKAEKGTLPKYEVIVPVIDPMKKLKSITLHYIDGAESIDAKKSGELQLTGPRTRKMGLFPKGAKATAALPLPVDVNQSAREVTVQVQLVNAAGKTVQQDPVVIKVAAPQSMTTTVQKEGNTTTFTQTTQTPGGGTSRRQVTVSNSKGGTAPAKPPKMNNDDETDVEMEETPKKVAKSTSSTKSGSKSKPSDVDEETDVKSDKKSVLPVWTNKISKMKKIPDEEVTGKIDGLDFKLGRAVLQNTGLQLEMGRGDSDDGVASIHLFLFTKGNEDVSGRKLVVNGRVRAGDPHIHLSCQRTDDRVARSQAHLDYLLVLEFGEYNAEDRVQPGKIYACFPDRGKSFFAGSFEARVD